MTSDGLVWPCVRCRILSRVHSTITVTSHENRLEWQCAVCDECLEWIISCAEEKPND
jgi:hypothetical protein